jgi:tetratricopeptide (TPR) repeat protein
MDAESQRRLTQAFLVTGQLERAAASADRLVAIEPRSAAAYIERARIHAVRGDVPPALADLRRAGTLEPAEAEPVHHELVLERAIAQLSYLIGLKLGAEADGLHRIRAQARERRGDLAGALADFDRALQLKPDDVVALAGRADIRFRRLDFAGALADFRAALAIDEATASAQGAEAQAARTQAGEIVAEFGSSDRPRWRCRRRCAERGSTASPPGSRSRARQPAP